MKCHHNIERTVGTVRTFKQNASCRSFTQHRTIYESFFIFSFFPLPYRASWCDHSFLFTNNTRSHATKLATPVYFNGVL